MKTKSFKKFDFFYFRTRAFVHASFTIIVIFCVDFISLQSSRHPREKIGKAPDTTKG